MSNTLNTEIVNVLSGTISINHTPLQGNCEFCQAYTYNGYNLLNKLVCENCRDKILSKIQLILDFK